MVADTFALAPGVGPRDGARLARPARREDPAAWNLAGGDRRFPPNRVEPRSSDRAGPRRGGPANTRKAVIGNRDPRRGAGASAPPAARAVAVPGSLERRVNRICHSAAHAAAGQRKTRAGQQKTRASGSRGMLSTTPV